MKTLRALAATVVSIFIMLVFAFLFAASENGGGEYYASLPLPPFAPTRLTMHILMPIEYAMYIYVFACLIAKRKFKTEFILLIVINLLSLACVVVLFVFHLEFIATFIMFAVLAFGIIEFFKLCMFKKGYLPFLITLGINTYLTVVMIFISMKG